MELLESLFCSKCHSKLLNLEAENHELTEEKIILTRNYQNLLKEKNELVATLTAETLELYQQIQDLQALIASSTPIPDISEYIDSPKLFKPFVTPIDLPIGLIADEYYYTWTLEQWKNILDKVQKIVRANALKNGWVTDISDCDDFASVMTGHLITTFVHSGVDKQGAFLYVRSQSHAYNVFIAYEGEEFIPYVYEPQTDKVVGKLSEVNWEPYVTIKGWYLGTEVTSPLD